MISYQGIFPNIDSSVFVAENATLIGRVTIQKESSIWYNAVLRGDLNAIEIGEQTNLQEGACVHVTPEFKTIIGNRVTVGHGVILHGCQIEDDVLIGMGAIILDGAVIQKGALVAAGCVVPPHKVVPAHHLVMGNPMKIVRLLTPEEQQHQLGNAQLYVNLGREYQSQQ